MSGKFWRVTAVEDMAVEDMAFEDMTFEDMPAQPSAVAARVRGIGSRSPRE